MAQRNDAPNELDANTATVELPSDTVSRVEARLERSEFATVDDYVTFVVREVLARVEDATGAENVDTVDRREVETRLEALGYLE